MTALRVDGVSKQFGGVQALDGVSLTLEAGERRALLGPNGSGKTTLFNLIGGQLSPTQGRVFLFGQDVTALPAHRRAHAGLARTFQITTLFPSLSVAENIHLAVLAFSRSRYALHLPADRYRDVIGHVETLLADWRFGANRATAVRSLSYGEQRKLEIAMALAHRPRLLLLDEPAAGLSTAETQNVVELIQRLDREVTVLVIEHDMDVAFEVAERFTILYQGRIVADGTADQIRANEQVQSIYFGEDA
jgi:branched-chain amino acid transport system ATP-binding protein